VRKKIAIAERPQARSADEFVTGREGDSEPSKRLTVDLPRDLHTRVKVECAKRGQTISEVIRELLEKEFS
jgi:hypothetical protein